MKDFELTRLQETGSCPFYRRTLAELVDGVEQLGIDPRNVVVIGAMEVAGIDIPPRVDGRGNGAGRYEGDTFIPRSPKEE